MKSEKLGWVSVALASACCVLPLAAVLLGLGSIGLGSILDGMGIYFDVGGLIVLSIAWLYFLRERRRACALNSCIRGERRAMAALSVSTILVVIFAGSGLAPSVLRAFRFLTTPAQGSQASASRGISGNPGAYLN